MTEIIHTKSSVYEIDHDESLFRRVWSNNDVWPTGDVWQPFVSAQVVGGWDDQVLVILTPNGGRLKSSAILS